MERTSERWKVLELFEANKEELRTRINAGIEVNRKGSMTLTVNDKNGNPIPGAHIKAVQKSHEFRFGANLFMLDELETPEKNARYKEVFKDTFNMATLPFYWDATEPERGKTRYDKDSVKFYRRPAIDLCMEFCEENGIEPREHGLAYDMFFPTWLHGADAFTTKKELIRRYKEISERYADKIPTIEVTNEMAHVAGRTEFYEDPDYVTWCFKLAEKYFPQNKLVINEGTTAAWRDKCRSSDKYYSYIESAMLKGARIDAIGLQFHVFHKRENEIAKIRHNDYNPERLYRQMDLYTNLTNALQITEVTIPAYSNDEEDEAIQAELLSYLYPIWFSHPAVEQIIYWNLVDGYAHVWSDDLEAIRASQGNMELGENIYYGGLLRFDMSEKPALKVIRDLIKKEWHTEAERVTSEGGSCTFRGFYGDYDVEIETENGTVHKTLKLSSKAKNAIAFNL